MTAHIFQLNISDGGVPKTAVRTAELTELNLIGDKQRNLKYHGGPTRALCLYSLEHILALQAEGHPIYPGSIGENVTIADLQWTNIVPGVYLRLGNEVHIEITSYAVPCRNIQDSFIDQKFGRVSAKSNPGWSRAYAKVLQTGLLTVGDPVLLEPPHDATHS